MAKVSVIVPVYNTQEYLVKCLDSLVGQTLEDLEIIIIDDGSTDESPKIIDQYYEQYQKKIKLIRKENGGQAAARNLGIAISECEYIGFLDSDDYADPTMFQKLYEKAVETDADLVECNYVYLDEQNQKMKQYGHLRPYKNQKEMFINPLVSPWNKLFKSSILKESGVLFPEGVIYEDTAFFIQLIPRLKKVEFIQEDLIFHILRASSTMNAVKSRRIANIFVVLKKIIEDYQSKNLFDEYQKELEYFSVKILLCSSLGRISRVKDKEIRNELLQQTKEFIQDEFPGYRHNPYFKGGFQNLYMKTVNGLTLYGYSFLLRVFRR